MYSHPIGLFLGVGDVDCDALGVAYCVKKRHSHPVAWPLVLGIHSTTLLLWPLELGIRTRMLWRGPLSWRDGLPRSWLGSLERGKCTPTL